MTELRDRIEAARAAYAVPGLSWAIHDDHAVADTGALGVREAGGDSPVTETTRFQACSISKPVAVLGMLRLVDRGLLDLDQDVNERLTSWRIPRNGTWQPVITLRHLASHSAGLTASGFPGYRRTDPLPDPVQILSGAHPANTEGVRVDTMPGVRMRYSGGGMTVMQQLLEDVTGTPFADLMRELVLDPIGMADSDFAQPPPAAVHDRLASGHDAYGRPVEGGWNLYPEQAAAGLWTTPADLCRWALAVRAAYQGAVDAVLSRGLAREMLAPRLPTGKAQTGGLDEIGLGVFLAGRDGQVRFGHSGSNVGFQCHALSYHELGSGAVVMSNSDRGYFAVQRALAAIAERCGWPDYPDDLEEPKQPDRDSVAALAGHYRLHDASALSLRPVEDELAVRFDGQPEMIFGFVGQQDGQLIFASRVIGVRLELELEGTKITVRQDGTTITGTRH
ncbi:serine hydrolase domain-containing protein [Microlunatus parietis]|uniref:CubicO group peptidase (Beta-lactamase class C family) n=1 Tax=Microlunatus parietis TaxID=682979 RepID=A0A7Y9IBR4_9ACTN|nr:serine hydrolase domain-containing protein [Microlunatus parietis]NYE73718.1 CubicO group peptidase (beta-lactamase class C family) [Microlunatus parietis]